MITRLIKLATTSFVVLMIAIQLIRPDRTNPPTDLARTLTARMPVTPAADAVLKRACRDCHSNDTTWPWYSKVAPMSWLVVDHVNNGRRDFNYSEWARYDGDDAREILKGVCELARDRHMPLGSYLFAHAEARLSDPDVKALCDWTEAALSFTSPERRE